MPRLSAVGISGLQAGEDVKVQRERVGEAAFGHLDDSTMVAVNRALVVFIGFA